MFATLSRPLRASLCRRWVSTNQDLGIGLIESLEKRELLSQITSQGIREAVKVPTKVYLGADPTAESLHLGNLIPLMILVHFYIRGHTVMPLIGGATGMVGDPSGRLTERQQMEQEKRDRNIAKIHAQMQRLLENGASLASKYGYNAPGSIEPVNNYTWWKDVSMLGFLSQYGRHIRVSAMLARESVKARLNSDQGIGFNEFTYQVLQAFDFYQLYKDYKCVIQVGGNDQWGNITAGIDLINRLKSPKEPEPYGLTVPLLTTPNGEKFGKSAGNAVFVDKSMTRPYHMYQYFVKVPDSVVEKYLSMFTLMPLSQVEDIMIKHNEDPEKRFAQHQLALEVSELIHGPESAANARMLGLIMFEDFQATGEQVIESFKSEDLLEIIPKSELVGKQWKDLVAQLTGKSKSEAGRLVKQGAVYSGLSRTVVNSHIVDGTHFDESLLLVRVGKTDYFAIQAQ